LSHHDTIDALHDRFILEHTALVAPPLLPEIRLHLATEITPLWTKTQAWLDEKKIPPPYWAFAWVGGQALARFVLDHPEHVRDKRVLDFASGSGLVAIAASRSGAARVVASEIDALARRAIALNAQVNAKVNDVAIEIVDRDFVDDALDDVDVLLAGDVLYEQPMASRVGPWLCDRARAGRVVTIGDPGRNHILAARHLEELARYDVPALADVESAEVRSTGVFRVRA
jgi:predicted nicotinamide N-methyase